MEKYIIVEINGTYWVGVLDEATEVYRAEARRDNISEAFEAKGDLMRDSAA